MHHTLAYGDVPFGARHCAWPAHPYLFRHRVNETFPHQPYVCTFSSISQATMLISSTSSTSVCCHTSLNLRQHHRPSANFITGRDGSRIPDQLWRVRPPRETAAVPGTHETNSSSSSSCGSGGSARVTSREVLQGVGELWCILLGIACAGMLGFSSAITC